MSLRDQFAAKAIPSAIGVMRDNYNKEYAGNKLGVWYWEEEDFIEVAERAYEIADAMILVGCGSAT